MRMRAARMRQLAYLARYAPGAPTPWVMRQTLSFVDELTDAVAEIVRRESAKPEETGG